MLNAADRSEVCDFTYKVIVLGDSMVGKTSLINRFTDNMFYSEEGYAATLAVDFKPKRVEVGGKKVKLHIWDTAGQERFKHITRGYYKQSHGVVLAFDITQPSSFESLQYWLNDLEQNGNMRENRILVGTKTDLVADRRVRNDEATLLAREHNMPYIECSARTDFKVKEVFETLAMNMLQSFNGFEDESTENRRNVFHKLETKHTLGVPFGKGNSRRKLKCCRK